MSFPHIRKLKQVIDLSPVCFNEKNGKIQCGLTRKEFTGNNKFIGLRKCGCVFDKTIFDEVNDS